MRIDRMFFDRFAETVRKDEFIAGAVDEGRWESLIDYLNEEVFNRPEEFFTLEKLRRAMEVDRRLTIREILERAFDRIDRFKSKDELLEEEFAKFLADQQPETAEAIPYLKTFFKSYATSNRTREIIESGRFGDLAADPGFSMEDLRRVPEKYRKAIPEYIKDYVSLNQFAA
jgi:type I restriction enzyme R subunit